MNRRVLLVALGLMGCAVAQAKVSVPAPTPTLLTGAWSTVALPATPLHIEEHKGELWVCGEDEMIARSSDRGESWQVLHDARKGEFLFAFTFGEGGEVDAYGTDGTHLISADDGVTWKRRGFPDRFGLVDVHMFASGTGYGMAAIGVAVTHDHGSHWGFYGANSRQHYTVAMAALDDQHAATLDATIKGGNDLNWTEDGGRHWKSSPLPKAEGWTALGAEDGSYVLYGTRKDGAAITARQDKSGRWTIHDETVSLSDCSAQGCLVDGGWLDRRSTAPRYWSLPTDTEQPLTHTWAAAGDTFCRVSSTLRCRRGLLSMSPPRLSIQDPANYPVCGKCPDPEFPGGARRYDGAVRARVLLGPDGTFRQILLCSASSALQAQQALKSLAKWKFKPAKKGMAIPTLASDVAITFYIY